MPKNDQVTVAKNKMKFFHKHVVEGKPITRCAKEMDMSRGMLSIYKRGDDFRQMAIEYFESSKLQGLKGTVSRLVERLDSTDNKISFGALQEIIKIYGLYAPTRKDTTVTVSVSSDEELFRQIDEAQRDCRFVESHEKGEKGEGVADGEQGFGVGNFAKRQRALLQDAPVPEP